MYALKQADCNFFPIKRPLFTKLFILLLQNMKIHINHKNQLLWKQKTESTSLV